MKQKTIQKKQVKKIKVKSEKKIVTKKNKFEVKKNMTFAQILTKKPESMNILFENGLHCIGCHMSAYETIEQGCLAHGMSNKQIDELIKELNKTTEKKK
jgi:hybrid cluster-associated redox disulfide protein